MEQSLEKPAGTRRTPPERHTDIAKVQQWVLSSLVLVTVEHLATGLVIVAALMDADRRGDRIGLLINAGVIGMLGVVAFRLIHRRRWLSAWLPVGWIPALVGAYLIFWR